MANTKGNNYKLVNHSFHYDLGKHFSLYAFKAWLDYVLVAPSS